MAVSYSNSWAGVQAENGTNDYPVTNTQTITETGSNVCTVVGVTMWPGFGNGIADDTCFVESVTIDGNAATFLASANRGGDSIDVYYRAGAVGSNKDVVTTFNNGSGFGLMMTSSIVIETFTGVNQGSPIAQSTTASGLSRDPSGTLTPASSDNRIGDHTVIDRGSTSYTLTEDGAGTNRKMNLVGTLLSRHYGCASDVGGVTGAQTMSYNISGTTNKSWAMVVFELAAAVDTVAVQDPVSSFGIVPFPR